MDTRELVQNIKVHAVKIQTMIKNENRNSIWKVEQAHLFIEINKVKGYDYKLNA